MSNKGIMSKITSNGRSSLIRNGVNIVMLLIGAVFLCLFLSFMQSRASEYAQRENSQKILAEVTDTLQVNSQTVQLVENKFNSMNQSTIESLASYMNYTNLGSSMQAIMGQGDEAYASAITYLCNQFEVLRQDVNAGGLYMIDQDGLVYLANDPGYVGQNMNSVLTPDEMKSLLVYRVDKDGNVISNGTAQYVGGKATSFHPVEAGGYYTFSTLISTFKGTDFYLMMSQPTDLLEAELSGVKDISSVLSGITVGTDGFLFAIDTNKGDFLYYNDGTNDLSGLPYAEYGLSSNATVDDYAGYETIDGVNYYCVTRQFSSEAYGNYTIVAAVVSRSALLDKNGATVFFSCMAFILMAAILVGYGMILRDDIAAQTIKLQKKFFNQLKDEVQDGRLKYTEEEIQERTNIQMAEVVERRTDPHFNRFNLGNRNRDGDQYYFSTYVSVKILPLLCVGMALVFGISFFSQTLLGLQDATTMSQSRLSDVSNVLASNEKTADTVQEYIDQQYISKARLISYILEASPDDALYNDPESESVHPLFVLDDNNQKIFLVDELGNQRYSQANSAALQILCDDNDLEEVALYDDEGYVVATNTDLWYATLSHEEGSQSAPFWDILDGKVDSMAQTVVDSETGSRHEYAATVFYYYTCQAEDGSTEYVSNWDYQSQLSGTWEGTPITKHRGMVMVNLDQNEFDSLFRITSLDYVLSGMHVYGSSSFFVAFDTSEDHIVVYSPLKTSIGKPAAELGITDSFFLLTGTYNGFQKANGVEYYQTCQQVGDYYIATAIPTDSVYAVRNAISSYTLLFSSLFLMFACFVYCVSSDALDADQVSAIHNISNRQGKSTFLLTSPSGKKSATRSAASRYVKIAWEDRSPEEKLSVIVLFYMSVASIMILGAIIYAIVSGNDSSIITYILKGDWERGANVFAFTEALMVMVLVFTTTKLAQAFVRSFCGTLGARVETTGDLVVSVLRYGGVIGGLFYCLYLFGFNTANLITSAGILSIVIGLGAQSLISDIIAGIFIVFEGEFRVGDIVTIDGFRGQVLEIGLRTTKVEETDKNIKIFNNSSISGVINMTRESSFASVTVGIEYGESLERVELVLKKAFPKIRKKLPSILDGPFYKGVCNLGESSVDLRITAQCAESDRMQLTRDLNREILLLFNENGINIPFPQVTVSQAEPEHPEISSGEAKSADQFVAEQRVLSSDVEDETNKS